MSTAKELHELQEIDLDIEQRTQALEQVKSQLGKDEDLAASRVALEAAKKKLVELEHQQKTGEWEISDLGAKIAVIEKKLYGGSMKNPRELMGFEQDLKLLKTQRGELEDKLLAVMMDVEDAQQDVRQKSGGFSVVEKGWKENQQKLSLEKERLETELTALEQKRKAMAGQIDSATLKLYEEIRLARQGRAVSKVVQGRCQGCRISLSMSDQQRARMGNELARCSNCGRILYLS
jgi:predicted  nucleic acid-binding Zn-ribbon protein